MNIFDKYKALSVKGMNKVLSNSDEWLKWLRFSSKMYHYSAASSLAVYAQNPNATMLKTLKDWNNENRLIHKGQRGIWINVNKVDRKNRRNFKFS